MSSPQDPAIHSERARESVGATRPAPWPPRRSMFSRRRRSTDDQTRVRSAPLDAVSTCLRPAWVGILLLLAVPFVTSATASNTERSVPACSRAALESPPTWSWSGAWTHDGSRLLLVDVLSGELLVYDTQGRLIQTIRRPGTGPLDFNRANAIVATQDGFVLRDGVNHFVFLSADLTPQRGLSTEKIEPGVHGMPRSFFNWTVASGSLYGLGDVRTADEGWDAGWLEMDLEDPHRNRIFRPAPAREGLHRLYRKGYPYAASEGERVYFLIMEEEGVGILQVAPRIRRLQAFPEGFDSLPQPPDADSGRRTPLVYRFLQSATYPTGIYAWEQRLFVLSRSPAGDGKTRWELHSLDPEQDEHVGTLVLPTEAAHLSVIPGPTRWAVVEKPPVERKEGVVHQPVERVTFLASRLFREPGAWSRNPCPREGTTTDD